MSAHSDCYGTMFPDFTRLEKNKPLGSPAFSALVVSHGIGVQSRTLEVKPDGWDKCLACADYRTCYDLSLATLLMKTILANGWTGP
jgi:hypothetical protein